MLIVLVQTVVNVGMNIGIMPVTGIPLPFVTYGGSSMISTRRTTLRKHCFG